MQKQLDLNNINFIDLTHHLTPDIAHWSGTCGFKMHITTDYHECKEEVKFRVHRLDMFAGIGTHMDAPLHSFPDGKSVAEIELKNLIAPCAVINVAAKANENYLISPEDIHEFEKNHGKIKPKTFVILYTGWEKHWFDADKYRNNLRFPSLSIEAAEILFSRQIVGIGIDTLSPDRVDAGFPVHKLLLGAGKYIIENVANAASLPATGAYAIVLPIKIQNGTEAPVRLIGLIIK